MKNEKLKDITIKITDGSHFSPAGVSTGYPMLSSKDMGDYDFNLTGIKYISKETYDLLVNNGCKPQVGDIVIIKDGNSYLKKAFVIREERDIVLLSSIGIIRPDKTRVDPYYLRYFLLSDYVQKSSSKYVTGSAIPRVILANFGEIEVPLPPLTEQIKISSVLKSIDEKIENNNGICSDLEGMTKLLHDYWFVQFDFPDENGKPYKSSGGKMVWNEDLKREIPEGWEVIRLGDYITADRGISYNAKSLEGSGVPMINLASFNVDSTYKASGLKTYSGAYGEDQVLHPYDLVMCNTQQTAIDPAKDIIGKTLLVPDIFDGDIVSSHHVTTIHVADDAFKYYLHAESKTTWFHKYVAGFASGTNILGLDFNGVLNYKMPIPPKEIMSKLANISHSSEARKNEVIRENADLVGLRDFLLPMLMNGQVKVKGA